MMMMGRNSTILTRRIVTLRRNKEESQMEKSKDYTVFFPSIGKSVVKKKNNYDCWPKRCDLFKHYEAAILSKCMSLLSANLEL